MKPHEHQTIAFNQCCQVLNKQGGCYLAGEVRTGKTVVSLMLAAKYSKLKAYFVTKKNAISGINKQIKLGRLLWPDLEIEVINFERLHTIEEDSCDFVIIDEAHTIGAFPKPSIRARYIRQLTRGCKWVLMSGTPSPESYSQLFHQLWAVNWDKWLGYSNFYKWAKDYVDVVKRDFNGLEVNDYSGAKADFVEASVKPLMISMTQEDAGFKGKVLEKFHEVKLLSSTLKAIRTVVRDGVYKPLDLLALSAAQRMAYVHQLCSGTVITRYDEACLVDTSKLLYLKRSFKGRLAIFYNYVAEGVELRRTYPNHTADPEEFKANKKLIFICQIRAGQEGTDLSCADHIIFYNISYSASSYFQGRARGQHRDKADSWIHWLFSDYGFERKIYNIIKNGKAKYTLSHFRKDCAVETGPQITFGRLASS